MSTYGEGCAEFYDEIYGPPNPNAVRTLSRLAAGGAVLELGIATGRTALALSPHCSVVFGIESSPAMLRQLARKAGAGQLHVIKGDFATVRLPQRFDLIFALVNTLFLLEALPRQFSCLGNVSQMLADTGRFVVEAFRPYHYQAQGRGEAQATNFRAEVTTTSGPRCYEAGLLYNEPDELDALAGKAGLTREALWADWKGSPYRPDGSSYIAVYGRTQEQ